MIKFLICLLIIAILLVIAYNLLDEKQKADLYLKPFELFEEFTNSTNYAEKLNLN